MKFAKISFSILLIMFFSSCPGGSPDDAIESMLDDFAETIEDKDLDDARDFLDKDNIDDDEEATYEATLERIEDFEIDVDEVEGSGTSAKVKVTFEYKKNGQDFKSTDTYKMKLDKDEWKIPDDLLVDILTGVQKEDEDEDEVDEEDIENMLEDFAETIEDQDLDDARDFLDRDRIDDDEEDAYEASLERIEDFRIDVDEVDGSGDSAKVKVTFEYTKDGQDFKSTDTYKMNLDEDEWKIPEALLVDILTGGRGAVEDSGNVEDAEDDQGENTYDSADDAGEEAEEDIYAADDADDEDPFEYRQDEIPGTAVQKIRQTFDGFVAAVKSGNYQKANSYIATGDPGLGSEQDFNMMSQALSTINFDISDIRVNGNRATATIKTTGTAMGQQLDESDTGYFKLENGDWKIYNLNDSEGEEGDSEGDEDIPVIQESDQDQIQKLFNEFVDTIKSGNYQKARTLISSDNSNFPEEEEFNSVAQQMGTMTFRISDIIVNGLEAKATVSTLR